MCILYVGLHVCVWPRVCTRLCVTAKGNSVVIVRQWRITRTNLHSLITHSVQEIFQKLDMSPCSNCPGIIVSTKAVWVPPYTYILPPQKKKQWGGGLFPSQKWSLDYAHSSVAWISEQFQNLQLGCLNDFTAHQNSRDYCVFVAHCNGNSFSDPTRSTHSWRDSSPHNRFPGSLKQAAPQLMSKWQMEHLNNWFHCSIFKINVITGMQYVQATLPFSVSSWSSRKSAELWIVLCEQGPRWGQRLKYWLEFFRNVVVIRQNSAITVSHEFYWIYLWKFCWLFERKKAQSRLDWCVWPFCLCYFDIV